MTVTGVLLGLEAVAAASLWAFVQVVPRLNGRASRDAYRRLARRHLLMAWMMIASGLAALVLTAAAMIDHDPQAPWLIAGLGAALVGAGLLVGLQRWTQDAPTETAVDAEHLQAINRVWNGLRWPSFPAEAPEVVHEATAQDAWVTEAGLKPPTDPL